MSRKTYLDIHGVLNYYTDSNNVVTSMPKKREMLFLQRLASTLPSGCTVLEVGSFLGKSAAAIAEIIEPLNGQLHCIDDYSVHCKRIPNQEQLLHENLQGYNNIEIFRSSSRDWWPKCNKTYDMIFLDGDHSKRGFVHDLVNSIKWSHNIVCGHDFSINYPWIIDTIQKISEHFNVEFEIVHWTWNLHVDSSLRSVDSSELEIILLQHLEKNTGKFYFDQNLFFNKPQ